MRIGLFLSRGSGSISDSVDVEGLAEQHLDLAVVNVFDSFFEYTSQSRLLDAVREHKCEGVVLAGNSPKHYTRALNAGGIIKSLAAIGINDSSIAFANIAEQAAMPHGADRKGATAKAGLLIRVALEKLRTQHKLKAISVTPTRAVLVVGTNPGGILAGADLLNHGCRVFMADMRDGPQLLEADRRLLDPSMTILRASERCQLYWNAAVVDVTGWCGDYEVILRTPEGTEALRVGAILISAGCDAKWVSGLHAMLQLNTDKTGTIQQFDEPHLVGRTADPGVFALPGTSNDLTQPTSTQASAAVVGAISSMLGQSELFRPIMITEVDGNVCGGCGTCVKTCAFGASSLDTRTHLSSVDPRRCKGCGNCVTACPTGARDLPSFPSQYVLRAIDILSEGAMPGSEPKLLAILCNGCGYPAADAAGALSLTAREAAYPANVLPVRVECGGNVDTQYILEAFARGFDGVIVAICRKGHCHHVVGNIDAERRIGLFREVLRSRGIDEERLRVVHLSPTDGLPFSQEVNAFYKELQTINTVV